MRRTAFIASLCFAIVTNVANVANAADAADVSKPAPKAAPKKSAEAPAAKPTWPEYRGKAFKVSHPPGWKVQPLEAKSAKESDAATFTSPDGAMQLYIYSPQWGGTAPGIKLDAAKEAEVSRKSEPGKSSGVAGMFTWHTIAAKDKSYTRTYQSFTGKDEPIHWVIGMKYSDEAALAKYRADYARFKGSLEQFAD
jgi:hypothetical protein